MRYGPVLIAVLPIAVLVGGITENANIRSMFLDSSSANVKTTAQTSSSPLDRSSSTQIASAVSASSIQSATISTSSQAQSSIPSASGSSSSQNGTNGQQGSVGTINISDFGPKGVNTSVTAFSNNSNGGTNSTGGNNSTTSSGGTGASTGSSQNTGNSSGSTTGTPVSSQLPNGEQLSSPLSLSSANFGINIAEWDGAMNASSTIPTIRALGTGLQRYPNNDAWSWKLNRARDGSDNYTTWDSYPSSFSMTSWGSELRATDNQGVFNINYGMNSNWNGGQSVSDVQQLTHYILNNHIPVKAMVIGSENYAGDTINLRADKTPSEYATVAKQMAIAIHQIDPQMMVGVNLTPGLNGKLSGSDAQWNETVLRTDAPYIQFVTFHVYPVITGVSNTGLLSTLMTDLPETTASIRHQLLTNAGQYASHIQVWFTEFNLFSQPRPGTVEAVGGAATLESMLLARSLGVQQVDWWSLHGGAHQLLSNGSVAMAEVNHPVSQYGTFALVGDGQAPEIALNSMYATGQAMAKLTSLVSGGAQLQVERTSHLFVGKVTKGSTVHWIVINLGGSSQRVQIGNSAYTVGGTSYQIISAPSSATFRSSDKAIYFSQSDSVATASLATQTAHSAPPAIPHISSVSSSTIVSNQLLTIAGSGFGNSRGSGYVAFSNNNVHWGSPQNFYKLDIKKWTNSEIQLVTPSQSGTDGSVDLKPGTSATVTVFAQGQEASNTLTMHVHDSLVAHLNTSSFSPGQVVTVTGSGLGSSQGSGYVQFSDNNVNWGSPSNFYKLSIVSWKDNSVSFVVPTQHTTPGTVSIQVMSPSGVETGTIQGTLK